MIKCMLCRCEFYAITNSHLRFYHGIDYEEYRRLFPQAETASVETSKLLSRNMTDYCASEEGAKARGIVAQQVSEYYHNTDAGNKKRQEISEAVSKTKMGHIVSVKTRKLLSEANQGSTHAGYCQSKNVLCYVPLLRESNTTTPPDKLPIGYTLVQFEEWLTEFNNGDGSIGVYNDHGYYYVRVSFFQMNKDILTYISNYFRNGSYGQGTDGLWTLSYNGKSAVPFLEIFSRYVVGRYMLSRLSVACKLVNLPEPVLHMPTLHGFVGFWDAEGWSTFRDYTFCIGVSQSDKGLVEGAKELLENYRLSLCLGGNVGRHNGTSNSANYQWVLYRAENISLLRTLLEFSLNLSKTKELRYNLKLDGVLKSESEKEESGIKADRTERQQGRRDYNNLCNKSRSAERFEILEQMERYPEIVDRLRKENNL